MYFRYFVIISPWKRAGPFIEMNLNPLCLRKLFPSLIEIGLVVLEKKIFNFVNVFLFSSPLGKGQGSFIWTSMNSLYPRMLCANFSEKWPRGSGEEDLFISSMDFCYFFFFLPLKKERALHLNPLYPRMLCAKLSWNWLSGSGKEDFIYFVNVFFAIRKLSLKRAGPFIWKKTPEIPLPKDALCQDWLKLVQWFWRRRWKCKKLTNGHTDTQTGDGQQAIRKAHLSFQIMWTKKENTHTTMHFF